MPALSEPPVVILVPTVKATELFEQCEQVANAPETRGRTWTSNCHMGCIGGSVNYLWSHVLLLQLASQCPVFVPKLVQSLDLKRRVGGTCFLYCLRSATVISPLSSRRVPGPTDVPVFLGAQSYRWSSVALSLESIPIVILGVVTSHRVPLTVLHGSYVEPM